MRPECGMAGIARNDTHNSGLKASKSWDTAPIKAGIDVRPEQKLKMGCNP